MTDPIKPASKSLEQMVEENLLLTREVYSQTQKAQTPKVQRRAPRQPL